jgi:hypothetical protein
VKSQRSYLPILGGLLLAAACILAPTASPEPGETPDAMPDGPEKAPSPTVEPTATSTPNPEPPAGFFPIAVIDPSRPDNAVLLGGVLDGAWIDGGSAAERMSGDETYHLYSPSGPIGTAVGTKPTREIICDQYYLEWSPAPAPGDVVGLVGSWNAMPRIPEEIPAGDESHRAVVRDWWTAQGHPDAEILVTRAVRVDLDGDGVQEVLIAATRMSEATGHDVAAGDYSVVLLHKESAPQTILLAGEYHPEPRPLAFPVTYSLFSAVDLNGDSRMEVIVSIRRWEGNGNMMFAFDGNAVVQVFDNLCAL